MFRIYIWSFFVKPLVFFNRQPVNGPWGGGSKLLSGVVDHFGDNSTFTLDENVDIIFCMDPRPNEMGLGYQDFLDHKEKYGSKIVQRIGDVGGHNKPEFTKLIKETIKHSDYRVYISKWAADYVEETRSNYSVVHNSPLSCFYDHRNESLDLNFDGKIKIVTHHWSDNPMKGFDLYSMLGNSLDENSSFSFTFIGRTPRDFDPGFAKCIDPMDAETLSRELPKHDIYLTASMLEAGPSHVLEAMACGLPVVYRIGGGGLDEYCNDIGIPYKSENDLPSAMMDCVDNYEYYKRKTLSYDRVIDDSVLKYVEAIENVY